MDYSDFGNWLIRELGKRDLKQADLYKSLGLTSSGVSAWFTGRAIPSPDNLHKIAQYLGVSEIEVLRRAGIATTRPANSPLIEAITEIGGRLDADDQQTLLDIARTLLLRRKRNEGDPG